VDNASADGSADRLARRFPQVQLRRSTRNLGFAAGTNLGLLDLRNVDHVALVNSDAFVSPGWLEPLVEAVESEPAVGAACPKILFASRFVELELRTEPHVPGGNDPRQVGVRLSGVRAGSQDGWQWVNFVRGFYWPEIDHAVPGEPPFRWSGPRAVLWAPVPDEASRCGGLELRLASDREKHVEIISGGDVTHVLVGREPGWVEVAASGPLFDVVNNAGSCLTDRGYGADRGFRERDDGRFDTPRDVFAWCGAAVLLSGAYLEDVGRFCDRYFLYYEDFDLSWRGLGRGWRYRYVPSSVVRHIHAASTREGSATFEHFVHRNRLVTLVKNAPAGFAARQVAAFVGELRQLVTQEVVLPLARRQRPHPRRASRQLRAGLGFAKQLPHALRERRRIAARSTVGPAEVLTRSRDG